VNTGQPLGRPPFPGTLATATKYQISTMCLGDRIPYSVDLKHAMNAGGVSFTRAVSRRAAFFESTKKYQISECDPRKRISYSACVEHKKIPETKGFSWESG
jgi:hypothetical protein